MIISTSRVNIEPSEFLSDREYRIILGHIKNKLESIIEEVGFIRMDNIIDICNDYCLYPKISSSMRDIYKNRIYSSVGQIDNIKMEITRDLPKHGFDSSDSRKKRVITLIFPQSEY